MPAYRALHDETLGLASAEAGGAALGAPAAGGADRRTAARRPTWSPCSGPGWRPDGSPSR
ncbi:hypothetical protein ACRAWD_17665 [Caulobacter segnis]